MATPRNVPYFGWKNRLCRVVWALGYLLLFRYSPRPLHFWRCAVLRAFGARVGPGVHVYPRVRIWAPWKIDLREGCGIGDGVILYSQACITIGRFAVVSQGTHLCAGTHDYAQRGFPLVAKPIVVGNEAWLAAECMVLPGVTIGEGSVIGARAVVTKDMPPWMVCAGHPCRTIKPRPRPGE